MAAQFKDIREVTVPPCVDGVLAPFHKQKIYGNDALPEEALNKLLRFTKNEWYPKAAQAERDRRADSTPVTAPVPINIIEAFRLINGYFTGGQTGA